MNRTHHFAICRSMTDGRYFVTNMLFSCEDQAKKELGTSFHKIWTDGPSVDLEVFEPTIKKAKLKQASDAHLQTTMFDPNGPSHLLDKTESEAT